MKLLVDICNWLSFTFCIFLELYKYELSWHIHPFDSDCFPVILSILLYFIWQIATKGGMFTILRGSSGCRGYKRFFKRTALETSDYLKDDCLQVHCCVGIVKSHTEGPKVYSIPLPPSDIGQHFGQLLESGEGADVNFEVDGETFSAHKLILAARSPVFRAQLYGPMKDQDTKCIKVEDVEAPVFKVVFSWTPFLFNMGCTLVFVDYIFIVISAIC